MKSAALALLFSATFLAAPVSAANPLRGEASAFLREFADSPVDWTPWGDAAFARAKAEQKPVFLFVGSFTSELAGAMRRQTFSNPKNADWLNGHFVCVIVDRDERPDVAALYESYLVALKQLSGWPLNVWLTPDFQPYEGATYLSPSEDWGAPGFLKLAGQAQSAWATNPSACRRRASEAIAQMAPATSSAAPAWDPQKNRARMDASAAAWLSAFDAQQGGFGDAPRLPEPELTRFMLLQQGPARDAALQALRALATSAVRDPLDGGFFRHAADAAWRIPYQQKTLADQARIALAFLDAAKGKDERSFTECARGALDFALSRLALPSGGFAGSLDATGDAYTAYYSWSAAEIDASLGRDSASFKEAHGVLADGNVAAADDPSATYSHRNLLRSLADTSPTQAGLAAKLLALRDRRTAPLRDERSTAGDNGLMLYALARAGSQLGDGRYLGAAKKAFSVIQKSYVVSRDGALRRLQGSELPADADDYSALALGCRELAKAGNDPAAGNLADKLLSQLDARFYSASGTYFGASLPLGRGFFVRPLPADDPPSADALAIFAAAPHSREIAAALSQSLEETSPQAPGDQLLALALFAAR
ncbi:MAG TPA: DUF255 domain-containing protein [Opitutaceae bacterium]|jgi:hypothetical protein